MLLYVSISVALHVICVQITFAGRYLANSTSGLLALVLHYLPPTWLFSSKGKAGTVCVYGFAVSYNAGNGVH